MQIYRKEICFTFISNSYTINSVHLYKCSSCTSINLVVSDSKQFYCNCLADYYRGLSKRYKPWPKIKIKDCMCIIKLECFPEIVKHWTAVFATQGEILPYLIIQILEVGKMNHVWDDRFPPPSKYMHCLSAYKILTN